MGSKACILRSWIWVFILIACLIDFLVMVPNTKGEGSGDYLPPNEGDWIIMNDTYISSETIILNGILNVTNNATLTINNVTLLINSSSGIQGIYVDWGATLNIYDSNITALNGLFTFYVDGNMSIDRSRISRITGGIYINFGDVLITNSTIFNNLDYAIVCLGEPTIANNSIHSNYGGILTGLKSAPLILNNSITSNEWGIICNSVSYATLFGNNISSNTLGGIKVELGYFELHNNTIASNGGFGIQSDHASIIATNNTIYDNQRWGIYSYGAPIFHENNNFEKDGKFNKEGDVLQEWEVLILLFDTNNETLEDVHLTIYDNLGNIVCSNNTIGNFRTDVLWEYELKNNGSEIVHTPYKIIAFKGSFSTKTIVDINDNMLITIILDQESDEGPSWVAPVMGGTWMITLVFVIVGIIGVVRYRRRGPV